MKSIKNTSGTILKIKTKSAIRILLFSFTVVMMFNACSTKKNTFTRRAYHNLTAHYNTYWNGNESFKEGLRTLDKNVKDNYALVLPVYKYGNAQDAQSITPNMDRAIEKSSKVIQRHSMYFNRKEWVRKIDDSYMLIGKSYLYKREFSSARRTFEFVINRFKDEDSRYQAELWLARTYNQNKEFEKAESVLDNFNSSLKKGEAPAKLEKEFVRIYADFFIQQARYGESIRYLQRAIEINTKKKVKNRLRFILAQVYQELGDMDKAAVLYQQVIRKNPSFEMAFNAKINLAKTYDAKTSNRSMIVKQLNKMLKDAKNEDFRDQIYFALAEIYLKDGKKDQGTEYLRLSVATSVSNDYQKSISSLRLAEIHFEKPEYNLAQAYYDTAMQFLPRDYAAYDELKAKTDILTDLITNLQAIEVQDSLQRMAQMPEAERNAILDKLIKKIAEEEARMREEERERRQSLSMLEQSSRQENRNMQRTGGWYFSNPQAVSFGFSEFQKKWGRRKLEDLWRLSNKQIIDFGEEEELADGDDGMEADSTLMPKETDPKKREFYLQDLPLTEEQMEASNEIIEYSLFNIGYIYKDGLKNNPKSIESFEELIDKFPEHEHRLQVYYQLYKNYEEVPDLTKAEYYKNLIVQQFPDSDYAKIIIDPNYNLVLEAQRNAAANLYYDTYNAYMNNQFYLVINNYNVAAERYQESPLISKFEFLKSLSVGQIQNMDSLAISLSRLIQNYPESEIRPIASDILAKLRPGEDGQMIFDENTAVADAPELTEEEEAELKAISMYTFEPQSVHFFMALADASTTNVNALKIRLSDFNTRFFSTAQLKINSIVFQNDLQLITVGNFDNSERALNYYESVLRNEYVTSQLRNISESAFVVSVNNYPVFYREKNTEAYLKFFSKEYLDK